MLVLSRIKDESIIINGNIKVKVLSIKGERVRLGIDAPKDITINREEIESLVKVSKASDTTKESLLKDMEAISEE